MARVLLVDDDKDIVWLIAIVLQADPTLTLVGKAVDGESAVAMVQQHRPDVVLMDLMMPGFDGLEATRRIKAQWPETKILVLTSLTEGRLPTGRVSTAARTASSTSWTLHPDCSLPSEPLLELCECKEDLLPGARVGPASVSTSPALLGPHLNWPLLITRLREWVEKVR
jgi:CheY-like chemotaxis protein